MKKAFIFIIIILAGTSLVYFIKNSDSGGSLNVVANENSSGADRQKMIEQGEEIAKTLNYVKEIKLNVDLFSDPLFLSLGDFSVRLPKKDIGKRNPFSSAGFEDLLFSGSVQTGGTRK